MIRRNFVIRKCCGGLDESKKTIKYFHDLFSILCYVCDTESDLNIKIKDLAIEYYCGFDERLNWPVTYILLCKGIPIYYIGEFLVLDYNVTNV